MQGCPLASTYMHTQAHGARERTGEGERDVPGIFYISNSKIKAIKHS